MRLTVVDGIAADHEAAVLVWHAANLARLPPPTVDRVAQIWEKLADPRACLVIGRHKTDGDVLAIALAEPGRAEQGAGAVIPGYGHVIYGLRAPRRVGTGCRPPNVAGTTRACLGNGLEPYDPVDQGVKHARSTPVRRPGIPGLRQPGHAWRR